MAASAAVIGSDPHPPRRLDLALAPSVARATAHHRFGFRLGQILMFAVTPWLDFLLLGQRLSGRWPFPTDFPRRLFLHQFLQVANQSAFLARAPVLATQ